MILDRQVKCAARSDPARRNIFDYLTGSAIRRFLHTAGSMRRHKFVSILDGMPRPRALSEMGMIAVAEDQRQLWADEVRERLTEWANWTRGNQLIRGSKHVLANMIQRAAGDVSGAGPSGYEFTFDIETTDKAIARLRMDANGQAKNQKKYMKAAKRVLMSTYLGQEGSAEISIKLDSSEDHVKALLWYAESYVGRVLPEVERGLKARQKASSVESV